MNLRPALLLALAVPGVAAEWGMGVSTRTCDTTIYVPCALTPAFTLEGRVYVGHDRQTQSTTPAPGATQASRMTRDDQGLGLGFFYTKALEHDFRMYVGPVLRYGRMREHDTGTFLGGTSDVTFTGHSVGVAPTLGVEYVVARRFSLGLEAGASWSKATWSQGPTSSNVGYGSDYDGFGTFGNVILRYRF